MPTTATSDHTGPIFGNDGCGRDGCNPSYGDICPHCKGEVRDYQVSFIQTAFEEPGCQVHHKEMVIAGATPSAVCEYAFERFNGVWSAARSMSVGDLVKVKYRDQINYFLVDKIGFIELSVEEVRIWCSIVPSLDKTMHNEERRAKYFWLAKLKTNEMEKVRAVLELNDCCGKV